MPQSVRVEGSPVEATIPSTEMVHGHAYILVDGGGHVIWAPGTAVIRAGSSIASPQHRQYADASTAVLVRELRPGQKVTMEGR